MEYLSWASHTSQFEDVQKEIEEKVSNLVENYFSKADDYAIEKFIKSFCEPIRDSERLMFYHHKIHPTQLDHSQVLLRPDDYFSHQEQVKNVVLSELHRQYRHYITFLSALCAKS